MDTGCHLLEGQNDQSKNENIHIPELMASWTELYKDWYLTEEWIKTNIQSTQRSSEAMKAKKIWLKKELKAEIVS